jgi:hydroxymethylglutaryl-CoA reductase (NADPH)
MNVEENMIASIPMRQVGPLRLAYDGAVETLCVPMATFESPLWPSTARGARVSMQTDGIAVSIAADVMARSILLEAPSAAEAVAAVTSLCNQKPRLAEVVNATTRFGRFSDLHWQVVGNLIYLRIEMQTGDASGHNMVTAAAEAALNAIREWQPTLRYSSLSANYCTDKKTSAVNGILGRGKYAVAEMLVPETLCRKLLRTTPQAIATLNIRKNLLGTALAGGTRSANAHVANMLLAVYLATGQDAANIIEGSQAFTLAETDEATGDLRFSVTLPNLIVGTVGNGKTLPFVEANLDALGCRQPRATGENARRLAAITAATVLCGELSLMAALTNPGELMNAHRKLERANRE